MPSKQQSIVLGGLVVGLLSTSYLGLINMLCCAGVLAGSIVAVWHYTTTHELTVSAGEGATMGALAALMGAAIAMVLNFALIKAGIRSDLVFNEFILNRFGDSMAPEQYDAMVEAMEADITIGKYLLSGLFGLAVSAVFGAIGGAIGATIFKKGTEEVTA